MGEDFKHIYDSYFIFMNGELRLTKWVIKKQAQIFNLGMKKFGIFLLPSLLLAYNGSDWISVIISSLWI